jgi:hypothetical protein
MSVFGNIMSKVFGHANAHAAPTAPQQPSSTASSSGKTSGPAPAGPAATGTSGAKTTAPAAPQQPSSTAAAGGKTSGPASASPAAASPSDGKTAAAPSPVRVQVDVEAVLKDLASKNKEKLDWRNSIVDLMKLLNLDSGLSARKELAEELNYTGNTQDTAAMNIWLHKQVMVKLAENGGKVPDSLKS